MALIFVWVLFLSALGTIQGISVSVYETQRFIESEGYVEETHHTTTQDGYILEMHRIPYKRGETTGSVDRPVVFLMHGLLAASNSYVAIGRDYAIPFNLADAGFDVWMGNARGTKNSRRHVRLNPDRNPREFFDFTWNEIGMYDVAAMIDYILELTRNEKIHYIGHSQGGTSFLVLNSMRPEYNAKFASAHLLAGVGYQNHFPNQNLKTLAQTTTVIWGVAYTAGTVEVFPPEQSRASDARSGNTAWEHCVGGSAHKDLCELTGVRAIVEESDPQNDDDVEKYGGGSLKQIAHYGQNIRDKTFRQWDYGLLGNLQNYRSASPPRYNLGLITANVTMHYTVSDNLLDERDVLAMAADMPNTKVRKVARETFQHVDFATAEDVKELVTDFIIEAIASYK